MMKEEFSYNNPSSDPDPIDGAVTLKQRSKDSPCIKCFAHASAETGPESLLICGGFGETSDGKHTRLTSVILVDLTKGKHDTVQPLPGCTVLGKYSTQRFSSW